MKFKYVESSIMRIILKNWYGVIYSAAFFSIIYLPFFLYKTYIKPNKLYILKNILKTQNILYVVYFVLKNLFYSHYYVFLFGWLLYADKSTIQKKLKNKVLIKNLEHAIACSNSKRPLIIYSSHIGCFFLPLFIEKITNIFENQADICSLSPFPESKRQALLNKRINSFFNKRKFSFINLYSPYSSGRKIIKCLDNKHILSCILDNAHPVTKNIELDFLGHSRSFPMGIINFGIRYDCNFLFLTNRLEKGKIVVEFDNPQYFEKGNTSEIDHLKHLIKCIENKITAYPEHWTMWTNFINQIRK